MELLARREVDEAVMQSKTRPSLVGTTLPAMAPTPPRAVEVAPKPGANEEPAARRIRVGLGFGAGPLRSKPVVVALAPVAPGSTHRPVPLAPVEQVF